MRTIIFRKGHFIIVGLVALVKYWYYLTWRNISIISNASSPQASPIFSMKPALTISLSRHHHTIGACNIDSINNGMQDQIDYHPLFVVYDRDNRMFLQFADAGRNRCACRLRCCPAPLNTPAPTGISPAAGGKRQYRVIVGESFNDRTTQFGNPAEHRRTAAGYSAAIIVTLLFTAYFSLRRCADRPHISDRQPGNLSPNVGEQYQEIRPGGGGGQQLMARIDAANQRGETLLWLMRCMNCARRSRRAGAAYLLTQVSEQRWSAGRSSATCSGAGRVCRCHAS